MSGILGVLSSVTTIMDEAATPQAPINVPLPTYDWHSRYKMREFSLFNRQLESWFRIRHVKDEEKLDLVLALLGKEGFAAMGRWTPTNN